MNTYVTLMKLTDQGAKELRLSPKTIEDGVKSFEKIICASASSFSLQANNIANAVFTAA